MSAQAELTTSNHDWAGRPSLSIRIRSRLASWETVLAVMSVLLLVIASTTTPGFADQYNVESSLSQMAARSLMVLPLIPLIIAREIDISVASIAALSGIAMAMATESGAPTVVAILVALLVGGLCGAINAAFVYIGLPSLIVTLGTLAIFRGMCYVLVGGTPSSAVPAWLLDLSYSDVPGTFIPWNLVPFLLLAPVVGVMLHRAPFGRRIFAIGGNPEAARYAGVRSRRMIARLFIVSGVVSAMAGVVHTGLNSSASPDAMLGFELDAITVVFLGGVSFLGGRGRMSGVLWALVVVIALRSMLQLLNVGAYGQAAVVGLLLIFSLLVTNLVDQASQRLTARRRGAQVLGDIASSSKEKAPK